MSDATTERAARTRPVAVEASPCPGGDETPRSWLLFAGDLAPLVVPAEWFALLFETVEADKEGPG